VVWGFEPRGISVSWDGLAVCHRREQLTAEEKKECGSRLLPAYGPIDRPGSDRMGAAPFRK
jgi:hypothetical protein